MNEKNIKQLQRPRGGMRAVAKAQKPCGTQNMSFLYTLCLPEGLLSGDRRCTETSRHVRRWRWLRGPIGQGVAFIFWECNSTHRIPSALKFPLAPRSLRIAIGAEEKREVREQLACHRGRRLRGRQCERVLQMILFGRVRKEDSDQNPNS